MEPLPPRGGDNSDRPPLTPQEKAQLQKKLILLKKEYSRTFRRLQRAERVEKVKNYVRKTVAEQNLLLRQGEAEKDNTEPISPVVLGKASGEVHFGPCSTGGTSVTFNPEPELFLQSSGSRCTSKVCGEPCMSLGAFVLDKNQTKLSRRRTKGVPREAALEEREASSMPEIFQRNVVCEPEPTAPGAAGSQSPVFKGGSSSSKILETEGSSLTATTGGGGGGGRRGIGIIRDVSPAVLQPMYSQETPGGSISPGLPRPVPRDFSQESQGPSLGRPLEAGALASAERVCPEVAVPLVDFQSEKGREEAGPVEEEKPCGQEAGEGDQVASTDHSGAIRGLASPAQQAGERKVPEEEEDLGCLHAGSSSPRRKRRGRRTKVMDFRDQERGAGSPLLDGPPPAASSKKKKNKNATEACAVVEGLLFPVEYYVRTTRRMSSCQREVNVEPVVHRRGQRRAWGKEAAGAASPIPPEAVAAEEKAAPSPACDVPSSGATSSSSHAGGSVSCSSGPAESQEPPRRRGRPSHGATTGGLPHGKNGNGHKEDKAAGGAASPGGGNGGEPKQRGRGSLQAGSEATPDSSLPEPALGLSGHRVEGSGEETQLPAGAGESSQAGPTRDKRVFLPPGFAASALGLRGEEVKGSLLELLPSSLDLQEFCLPEEEFGLLKLGKCNASPAKPREAPPEPGVLSEEGLPCAGLAGGPGPGREGARAGQGALGGPPPPPPPPHVPREGFACELLLLSRPLASGCCPQDSQLPPTPALPLVGATPASQLLPPSQTWPEALSVSPSHKTPIAAGMSWPGSDSQALESHSPEEPVGEAPSLWPGTGDTPAQIEMIPEEPAEPQGDSQREEGRLQMTSKLKCASGSLVDVSTVWWESGTSSSTELCLLTACKTSVSLWRRLDPDRWEAACTWRFTKVPVVQLVPLPGVCSLACVALGSLEMEELWLLVPSSEAGGAKQWLLKAGDLKAVLGLQHGRLVTSCGSLRAQEVEVVAAFSAEGRRSLRRQTLMPPEETLRAFAEVGGMQEALVAMTRATHRLLVWNVTSGQLLRRISVGYSCPASVCHRVYADSGLLFVVLSPLHANENESHGSLAFRVVAINPKTARSTGVAALALPPGIVGRYKEGEVKGASAAAVLTSGSIAVWDLFLGRCTAVLPPGSGGNWSLVRWSVTDACLLAGQDNGSLCVYTYAAGLQAA